MEKQLFSRGSPAILVVTGGQYGLGLVKLGKRLERSSLPEHRFGRVLVALRGLFEFAQSRPIFTGLVEGQAQIELRERSLRILGKIGQQRAIGVCRLDVA